MEFWQNWGVTHRKEVLSSILEYWQYYFRLIGKHAELPPQGNMLDVGAGPYGIIRYVECRERHILDPLSEYYRLEFSLPADIRVVQGKAENMEYTDSYFDIVFCTNTLDHVQNVRPAVREIVRVLRPGGLFILSVDCCGLLRQNIRALLEKLGLGEIGHPHTFSLQHVEKLLVACGLSVVYKGKGIGTLGEYVSRKCESVTNKGAPNGRARLVTRTLSLIASIDHRISGFSKDQFVFIARKPG